MASLEDQKTAATHLESTSHDVGDYNEVDADRGASILEEEKHLSLWHTAKLHWRALFICKLMSPSIKLCTDIV